MIKCFFIKRKAYEEGQQKVPSRSQLKLHSTARECQDLFIKINDASK